MGRTCHCVKQERSPADELQQAREVTQIPKTVEDKERDVQSDLNNAHSEHRLSLYSDAHGHGGVPQRGSILYRNSLGKRHPEELKESEHQIAGGSYAYFGKSQDEVMRIVLDALFEKAMGGNYKAHIVFHPNVDSSADNMEHTHFLNKLKQAQNDAFRIIMARPYDPRNE